ncbi:hypothetical protein OIU85_012144 [Salix viminalis]|uniref:Pentatricopeptide repeat-containing protein n=1 Tax=Salix viminalis TaxID=40686 RepID=A0A9Q0SD64_SALVM|nr:hypothetical protein OIU85_012144 [Salix viminalis]
METKTVMASTICYANVIGSNKPKRFAVFSIKRDRKKGSFSSKDDTAMEEGSGCFWKGKSCRLCIINTGIVGLLPQAQAIWEEMLYSSFVPSVQVISDLIDIYAKSGLFDEVDKILDQLSSLRTFDFLPQVYSLAISCFGKGGQLELMEDTLKKMVSKGFWVDSATGNAFVVYYSLHGSLAEMEAAYDRLKRKNLGNLIWNLLLLSYSANFKMKTLQREFLKMMEAGFHPDLTTFNIRALAFSRMSLLWDLHLSLEHMKHDKVAPDLVTYGCVVDAYLDRRLVRNLEFALSKMHVDDSPVLSTDPLVFEVFGKGDFHSSSEAFMEFQEAEEVDLQRTH